MPILTRENNPIEFGDSYNIDSGGRIRVSNPQQIHASKSVYGGENLIFATGTNGTASSIFLPNETSLSLDVGTDDGDYIIRQTFKYIPYVPGKTQLITMTGMLGPEKTNVVSRIGYMDDNNGLFFQRDENGVAVVIRSKASGSVVDDIIYQSDWNLDQLNGGGRSKFTLDIDKAQFFIIDFLWQGLGRIRFGFDIGGKVVYVHEHNTANLSDVVYMSTPDLPLRYEIRNVGATASASSMKEICSSVVSEGGEAIPGMEFSVGNGVTLRDVTTTRIPIFAIRLKSTFNSYDNRKVANLLAARSFVVANDVYLELMHVHEPTAITATWNDVDANSCIEYSTDISALSADHFHPIEVGHVPSAQGAFANAIQHKIEVISYHTILTRNPFQTTPDLESQLFVIYCTALAGTANVGVSMTWLEI